MTGVSIYMEGGGRGAGRAALRRGMDEFLKTAKARARKKSWKWKIVCCGSREEAWKLFKDAVDGDGGGKTILLVDSEGPVTGSPGAHVRQKDKWDVTGIGEDAIHFMVQSMEAWIVADREALAKYYGSNFRPRALPRAKNIETVPPSKLLDALKRATRDTKKRKYHKINHASDLLARIEPERVKERCPSCRRLFEALES